ncbi:MAG TPA: hypothetical protein VJV23_01325 [Candidatus Polarisedimenticolia bacterium]|nr:hypothetical protein [Candidatus Polarisedimenticolia bacterium]
MMTKLLFRLLVLLPLAAMAAEPAAAACRICSFYTTDGQRRATCGATSAGSKTCLAVGGDCIQSVDCCGCSGPRQVKPGSTCLSRVHVDDCLEGPRRHHLPEHGVFVQRPQQAGGV